MREDLTPAPLAPQRATAREFFAVAFRRRWIILGLFAATTVTIAVIAFSTPATYISVGQVLLRRGEQMSMLSPERRIVNDWEIELGSEIQTVMSWPVEQRAQKILAAEAKDASAVPEIQHGAVQAEVTGKSNVISIGYVDRDADVARRVCDALIRAYVDYRRSEQLRYPQRFFDAEINQATAELQRWTEMRRQFANENKLVSLDQQRQSMLFQRAGLQQSRTAAATELAAAEAQERILGELRAHPDADLPSIGQPTMNENVIAEMRTRVVAQQSVIAQLRERYRDDAPEVVNASVTLDTLKAILQRSLNSHVVAVQSQVAIARAKLKAIDDGIGSVDAQLKAVPDQEAQITEMDRQVESWKARLNDLLRSSDDARVQQNSVPAVTVYVLEPAGDARPNNARDYVRLGLAPAFSLVVGIGLAFFIDGVDLTVHTSSHAEEEVHLPVLAAITERRRRGGSRPARGPA